MDDYEIINSDEFAEQAMCFMAELGLPDDEAEMLLDDYIDMF